jgi:hypothetical protein
MIPSVRATEAGKAHSVNLYTILVYRVVDYKKTSVRVLV